MSTPKPDVTIFADPQDPLTEPVVQYMQQRSRCNVKTKGIDESYDAYGAPSGAKHPHIYVGNKYFGGVECLGKFPLQATEFRMLEIDGTIAEPMCLEENEFDRLILFNGKTEHEWADMYLLYKKELASFWVVEEMDLSDDADHWRKLKPGEKHFITMILAFFSSLDQLVMENVTVNFGQEIVVPQVRSHFAAQDAMESIHAEAYALLIQTYIKEAKERNSVLRSVQTMPIIQKKAEWVLRYMDRDTVSLAERLVGFLCLEGVQFSGAFASIYWLKSRGLMPGLCFANALIARDEGLHAEASVLIFQKLRNKLPEARVHQIFREAVEIEREFVCESLPVSLIGMNATEMSRYIEYVGDYWLIRLGYSPLYNTKNPFDWMSMIAMQGKSSFFECRVSEYARANVLADPDEQQFSLDTEF